MVSWALQILAQQLGQPAPLQQISPVEAIRAAQATPSPSHQPLRLLKSLTVANTNTKTTSQTYTWMAPSTCSGSVKFRALCGAGGYIDEMWVAEEVTEAGCTSSTSSTTPEEEVATTTTTTTTTGSTSSTSESSASTSSSSTSSTVASNDSQTSGVPSLINGAQCFQWSVLILLAQIACNLVI